MTHYTVTAQRGKNTRRWILQATEAPGALSEVTNLNHAAAHMKEAISFVTGEPESEIEIELIPIVNPKVTTSLKKYKALKHKARTADKEAIKERKKAAIMLQKDGMTLRDIGAIFGLSHQRAQQIISS